MSGINSMVTNALEYYDKNREKNDRILEDVKYIHFSDDREKNKGDIERNRVVMFDENKKEIFSSRYEAIGQFDQSTRTWVWAWAVPYMKKKENYISRKILNYGLDIDTDSPNNTFLKTELITGRFRISEEVQLDLHVAIASYIAKMPNVFTYVYDRKKHTSEIIGVGSMDNCNDCTVFYLFLFDDPASVKKTKKSSQE